jgi:hypothetical protein
MRTAAREYIWRPRILFRLRPVALLVFLFLGCLQGAHAGTVNCTPTSGFNTCKRITYSGSDQTFTVPNGVTSIDVRVWGSAGGGANSSYYTQQGGGAGGGYSKGTVTVSGGQVLGIVTGQGGIPNSTAFTYGWGGPGGNSTNAAASGASGGGMSGVFSSTTLSQATSLVLAGGGGGASPAADVNAPYAGGGGGNVAGQDGVPASSGRGGTQSAGGAAATVNSSCSVLPTAGSVGNGGGGGSSNGSGPNEGGGGGGGGYWGGGGGMCQSSGSFPNGPGGGGSGFTAGSVTGASMTSGSNFPYSGGNCTGAANSGGSSDTLYAAGIGQGSCYGIGGNGEVVIQYHMPTITLTIVSNGGVGGFTFTGTNGWTSQTITTVTSGVSVTGATQMLTATSTATNVTLAIPSGYIMSNAICSGMGSGTMTPGYATGLMAFNAAATATANDITCTITTNKTPTFKLQVTTQGGASSPSAFSFIQTNLTSTPSNIATTAANTATPAAPTSINVSTIGTVITVTGTPPAGFDINAVSCTDANSAITGNTGTFGTVVTNVLTVAAARVVAGADFTCVLSSNKLPTLTFTENSSGGVASFTLTGNNGWSSQTITTVTPGVSVVGPTQILTSASTSMTIVQSLPAGFAIAGFGCSGTNSGSVTPTYATATFVFDTLATAPGNIIQCTVIIHKLPTLTLTEVSTGNVGGFTFTGNNGWSLQTITTSSSGVGLSGVTQTLSYSSTTTNINHIIPTGYVITSITCSGVGSGSYTPNTTTGAVSVDSAATAPGAVLACTYNHIKTPTLKLQVTTLGGASSPASFSFGKTNLASTPTSITTTAANTPTPASPTAISVLTIGTAVTLTQTTASGFFLSGASCTDTNSAITGNTGSIGTLSGLNLTLLSGTVVAGAEFTCVFSNTKAQPQLSMLKTASPNTPANSGQIIIYTYKIINIGNVAISNISVSDVHNGFGASPVPQNELLYNDVNPSGDSTDSTINSSWDVLAPGDSITFNSNYTVVQADVDYHQ